MTEEKLNEFQERMLLAAKLSPESGHQLADEILCEMLTELGYHKIAEIFKKMEKWYA